MNRNFASILTASATCALLAACGGNGGGANPTPTPTPTPTSTGTPTPTPPPPPVNFAFTQAFTDTVTNTSYSYAFFTPNSGGAEVWSDGNPRTGTSTITYAVSPESVKFTWPDGSDLMTLDAADRQTATPTLRTYRDGTDMLSLELPFDNILRVSYERRENFTRETVPGTLRANRVTIFFNEVTTAAAITTNLSYTGTAQVVGGKSGSAALAVSAQPTTLTVAASDKKITGTITIVENVNGTNTVRASLPISATVAATGAFSGNINDTANAFTGTFVGALAGPNREEAFIIFVVTHTDGRKFIGSLIAT